MCYYRLILIVLLISFRGEAYRGLFVQKNVQSQRHLQVEARGTDSLKGDFLALDFDGVVCDSSPESSVSAIKAIDKIWGLKTDGEEFETIKRILMELRPIVETGYENILLARLALQEIRVTGKFDTELILSTWSALLRDSFVEKYGVDKQTLVNTFGETRDHFIATEFQRWLDLNPLFPGIEDTFHKLRRSDFDLDNFFIITTKQERFVREILKSKDLLLPQDTNLYGLENKIGSKAEVLLHLTNNRLKEGHRIHFVEDRVETLVKIASTPGLEGVKLYLVDWGYTTPGQKQVAEANEKIEIIGREQFDGICERFSGAS